MKIITAILLIVSQVALYAQSYSELEGEFDQFFQTYVSNNRVKYALAKKNSESLEALSRKVASIDKKSMTSDQIKTFYINTYNFLVIMQVSNEYPIKSVMDVAGFFDQKHQVASESLSLNEIEKQQLLPVYKDPRFHFVLVCGAVGCPPLINSAYKVDRIEKQLEFQSFLAMNNNDFIRVNEKETELSEIFRWYQSDFGDNKKEVVEFINKYRNQSIPANHAIKYYNYDWSLNDFKEESAEKKKR